MIPCDGRAYHNCPKLKMKRKDSLDNMWADVAARMLDL